jgi:hypothetical protein
VPDRDLENSNSKTIAIESHRQLGKLAKIALSKPGAICPLSHAFAALSSLPKTVGIFLSGRVMRSDRQK